MIVFDGRGILLDVEGTTSSIAFVYDVLFAHAKAQLGDFLAAHADDPLVRAAAAGIATRYMRFFSLPRYCVRATISCPG